MSNVKRVRIEGNMTFDASEVTFHNGGSEVEASSERCREMMEWLSYLNLPAVGIRIHFLPGGDSRTNRGTGGVMTFVRYEITGEEALAWPALEDLVRTLERVGFVSRQEAMDVDEGDGMRAIVRASEIVHGRGAAPAETVEDYLDRLVADESGGVTLGSADVEALKRLSRPRHCPNCKARDGEGWDPASRSCERCEYVSQD
jgi:hypothetical protein